MTKPSTVQAKSETIDDLLGEDTDPVRVDRCVGEWEISGPCEGCGKKVRRKRTIARSTYAEMMLAGQAWNPELRHKKCGRSD